MNVENQWAYLNLMIFHRYLMNNDIKIKLQKLIRLP